MENQHALPGTVGSCGVFVYNSGEFLAMVDRIKASIKKKFVIDIHAWRGTSYAGQDNTQRRREEGETTPCRESDARVDP